MHVILTPIGSAGDMNPFVIVGRELRRRGHEVTFVAPEVFAGLARNAGLTFVQLGTAADFDRVTDDPDLWDPNRGIKIVLGEIGRRLREAYAVLEELYEPGKTIFLGHGLSFSTRVFEDVHQAPAVTVHFAPGIFRSDFEQPALPNGADPSRWPLWIKRLMWWSVDRFILDPLIAPALNQWRAELKLPPVSRVFKSWMHSPRRALALFPDWFAAPQPDWPPQLRLTGFVLSDETCTTGREDDASRAALEAFLSAGAAPVVVTPGSANRHATEFFRAALDATSAAGRRALLVTGYRSQLPAPLPPHAHHVDYAPFATLFPRAAAVVHHGGIGTCAQALAAGVPQIVMPMGFDQPDNARRLERLNVARAIWPARFTGARVAGALKYLLSDDGVHAACGHWRSQIDGAAAVRRAVDHVEEACRPQR